MEPINEQSPTTASIEKTQPTSDKRPLKAPERVSLSESEAKKLDHWIGLAREASKGFLTLSRSDLVSFFISEHREELSPAEMKRLRALHYDPIKHIQWIMPQIKSALAQGDRIRVAELQAELRGVELSILPAGVLDDDAIDSSGAVKPIRQSKKRTKKLDQSESVTASESATCIDEMTKK